jgi:DNA-directed RNA polymerase subunit M/transcription elongation factor TFIIS
MKKFTRLLKCSSCGNAGEFEYLGSRNVNREGEVKDIVGDKPMWISYFRCPNCGSVEVEFHPLGEEPDVPKEFFVEVGKDGKKLGK